MMKCPRDRDRQVPSVTIDGSRGSQDTQGGLFINQSHIISKRSPHLRARDVGSATWPLAYRMPGP